MINIGETQPLLGRSSPTTNAITNKYLCYILPTRWFQRYEYSVLDVKNTFYSTVILLINSMIGSGILVQAYAFKESGIINATFVCLIIGYVTYCGLSLLAKSADVQGAFDYSTLVSMATGSDILYDLTVAVGNIGALLSYFLIIGSLTVDILLQVNTQANLIERSSLKIGVTFLTFLVVLPFCFIRNYGHLTYISYISMSTIIFTVGVVMVTAIAQASDSDYMETYSSADDNSLKYSSFSGTFHTLGSVVFAFGFAPSVLHAYKAASERLHEVEVFNQMLRLTVSLGVFLCFLMGTVGYLTFRSHTLPNILENYKSGFIGVLVKIPFIVHLMLYIPGDFVIWRYSLLKLCDRDIATISDTFNVISSIVLMSAVAVTSCFIMIYANSGTSLALILQVTGGISGALLNFVLPAVVGMRLLPPERETNRQVALTLGVGITVPVLVLSSLAGFTFVS